MTNLHRKELRCVLSTSTQRLPSENRQPMRDACACCKTDARFPIFISTAHERFPRDGRRGSQKHALWLGLGRGCIRNSPATQSENNPESTCQPKWQLALPFVQCNLWRCPSRSDIVRFPKDLFDPVPALVGSERKIGMWFYQCLLHVLP